MSKGDGIQSRGANSWRIQVYTGKDKTGKRIRFLETVHGKREVAERRRREILHSLDQNVFVPPGKMTVAEHLEQWLDGYVKTNCSPRTLDGYRSICERHLMPAFGDLRMKQLTPAVIQAYYGKASATLSNRTVHHQHRVLSESLKYALRQGYLGRNPCDLVDPPSPGKKAMRTLTPEEVERLLAAGQGNYYYPIVYTALSSGLRQAELLGLRWRDVDLPLATISVAQVLYKRRGVSVFKEPKTQHSRRRVAMTPKLALYLKDYKADRQAMYTSMGKTLGLDDLLFTSWQFQPLHPAVLGHNFNRMAKAAGIEGVRFHDLRHTFASLMLLRGAAPKVISEALGHSSVAFTMDTYSHIIQGMQEEAMALLNDVLPAGVVQNLNASLTPS